MDIEDFLNNFEVNKKIIQEKKQLSNKKILKDKFVMYIATFLKKKIITLNDYTFMIKFLKTNGSIVNLSKFHNIIHKIAQLIPNDILNIFIKNCDNVFSDIYSVINNPLRTFNKNIKKIDYKLIGNNMIKDNEHFKFTKDQRKAIKNIFKFMGNQKRIAYVLYGYAGTGKTTTIIQLISYLLKKKLINYVCFTAPTNKAVNIMKSKFKNSLTELLGSTEQTHFNNDIETLNKKNKIAINFITIHKLLNYKNDFDSDGEKIFVQGNGSKISSYDLVIIDECSMNQLQLIVSIFEEIKNIQHNSIKNIKVLFVGDPAQLPPVNEIKSIIFAKNKDDFKLQYFKEHISEKRLNDDNIKKKMRLTQKNILNLKHNILTKIVRTKNNNVIRICNDVRKWIDNGNIKPHIKSFGEGVYIYKLNGKYKTKTKWFEEFIKKCKDQNNINNIILTWTNAQTNEYNNVVRHRILNKDELNQYEIGDMLIFKDFYNFEEYRNIKTNKNKKKFYTSEQIIIVGIDIVTKKQPNFIAKCSNKIEKLQNGRHILNKYLQTIQQLNSKTKRKYNVCDLSVNRCIEYAPNTIPTMYQLFAIENSSKNDYNDDLLTSSKLIKEFRNYCSKMYKQQLNRIDDLLIRNLWKQRNKIFIYPFANISWGASISCHRSQGSTYDNVFVDINDIFKNPNLEEAKRCLYTALTRASISLYLLI